MIKVTLKEKAGEEAEDIKGMIEQTLRATNREGMDDLLEYMEKNGFYTAPCSTSYHLAKAGGLAEHSLNVATLCHKLYLTLDYSCDVYRGHEGHDLDIGLESVYIVSLLHDIGKIGQFGKPNYIANMLKGRATKANPNPELVQSTAKPYVSNPDLLYVDHEIRSISIIEKFIDLTEDEYWAILMHNGLYGSFKYQIQGKETPLYLMLHFADMWASRVMEVEDKTE